MLTAPMDETKLPPLRKTPPMVPGWREIPPEEYQRTRLMLLRMKARGPLPRHERILLGRLNRHLN